MFNLKLIIIMFEVKCKYTGAVFIGKLVTKNKLPKKAKIYKCIEGFDIYQTLNKNSYKTYITKSTF